MSLAVVHSRAQLGLDAPAVAVEVHLANGLPGLSIVGLPETAVRESKDRVRAAIQNSRFEFPTRRITINLAPADLPKEGGRFDLPIALGILAASRQLSSDQLEAYEFVGELALSGSIRPIRGCLPVTLAAHRAGRSLVVPADNLPEASLAGDRRLFGAHHLLDVTAHFQEQQPLLSAPGRDTLPQTESPDLRDVRGQHQARRALEIAAAGQHSLLMCGPPGTGKTLLASRLPGILPVLDQDEALEVAAIRSIAGLPLIPDSWQQRPFRAPHHTASSVALVGGGPRPRPGEVSLAHNGVLFLDELPEFDRKVLETLREPLENGRIIISRAAQQAEFPAGFQLIAAMNPCPCGYLGDCNNRCHCSSEQIQRYRNRISGPLLDRIDLHISVTRQTHEVLQGGPGESSQQVRERVERAACRQQQRQGSTNSRLPNSELERVCVLDSLDRQLLHQAIERLQLSARAYHRILKIARTIADLAEQEQISRNHLLEALQYRTLDRPLIR